MKKQIKQYLIRAFLIFAFIVANHVFDGGPFDLFMQVGPASAQVGQALTTTTTVAIIGAGQNCFTLTSVAGISGFGPGINNPVAGTAAGTGNVTDLYMDRELMQVVSTNTAAKVVCVLRGQGGSQASPHQLGVTVWIGPPGAFFNYDPEGYCAGPVSGTNFGGGPSNPPQFTPWINQRTSMQWICSTALGVWVPGFGNPGVSGTPPNATAIVPSAATIAPSGPIFHTTGTVAMVTITPPPGAVNGTTITIFFDGSAAGLTWTAAGNIAVAGTATTTGSSVVFTWNATTSKWSPSRVT